MQKSWEADIERQFFFNYTSSVKILQLADSFVKGELLGSAVKDTYIQATGRPQFPEVDTTAGCVWLLTPQLASWHIAPVCSWHQCGLESTLVNHCHSTQSATATTNVTWECVTSGYNHRSTWNHRSNSLPLQKCYREWEFTLNRQEDSGHVLCGQMSLHFSLLFFIYLKKALSSVCKSWEIPSPPLSAKGAPAHVCVGMEVRPSPTDITDTMTYIRILHKQDTIIATDFFFFSGSH